MKSSLSSSKATEIIDHLLDTHGSKPGKQVKLKEKDIINLCIEAQQIVLRQPTLLELEPPVNICGDIHGQFHDLLQVFETGGLPPKSNYLFLGDYVDRGIQCVETMCLLLAFKVKYPENFYLLRGNHEDAAINKLGGFYAECKKKYSERLWKTFNNVFNCLPLAAVVGGRIFCVHGGLSPHLSSLDAIRRIQRPLQIPMKGLVCDLVWSDPNPNIKGWGRSQRGTSYSFGSDVVEAFLKSNDMDLVCRAHEMVEEGYRFFGDRQLVTVFSVPKYCGMYNNVGAIMEVDEQLRCDFKIVKPASSCGHEGTMKLGSSIH